jgi:hypothetical protein
MDGDKLSWDGCSTDSELARWGIGAGERFSVDGSTGGDCV